MAVAASRFSCEPPSTYGPCRLHRSSFLSCCFASHSSALATAASVAFDPPKASTSACRRPSSRPLSSAPIVGATIAATAAPGASTASTISGGDAIGSSTGESFDSTCSGAGSATGSGSRAICTPWSGDSTTSVERNDTSRTTRSSRRARTIHHANANSTSTWSDRLTVKGGLRRTTSSIRPATPRCGFGPLGPNVGACAPWLVVLTTNRPGTTASPDASCSSHGRPPTSVTRPTGDVGLPRRGGVERGFIREACDSCGFFREFHPGLLFERLVW